ncbi:hypothetical protein MCOR25_010152 [Pyricularia grisea]|nr:hypothetical protein MCOR25_010152 [Pyricularia grisea]
MSTMQPPPNHRSTWSHHVNPHHHVNTDTDYNMQMHMQSHSYAAHVPLQRPGLSQQMTYHAPAGPSFPSGPSFGHDIKLAPLALPSTPSRGQSPASIHSQSLRGPMAVGGSRTAPRRESPELKATPISPAGSGRDMIASGSPDNAAGGRLMNVLMKKMEEKGQDSKAPETENRETQYTAKGKKKTIVCPFEGCGHRCAQQGQLETHMRKHTGQKPFKCRFCSFRASQRGNLNGHENTHTGARPYACDKCDKKFPTKGNLHNHSKTHDATRYSCPLDTCKRSYSNTNNLKTHLEKNHADAIADLIAKVNSPNSLSEAEKKLCASFFKNHRALNRGIKGRGQGVRVERVHHDPRDAAAKVSRSPNMSQPNSSSNSSYSVNPAPDMQFYHGHMQQQLPSVSMFHSHGFPASYLETPQPTYNYQPTRSYGHVGTEMPGPSNMCFDGMPQVGMQFHGIPGTNGTTSPSSSSSDSVSSEGYSDVGSPGSEFVFGGQRH